MNINHLIQPKAMRNTQGMTTTVIISNETVPCEAGMMCGWITSHSDMESDIDEVNRLDQLECHRPFPLL